MLHRTKEHYDENRASQDASTGERRLNSPIGPRRRSSALRFFASGSPLKQEAHAHSQKQWEADYLKSLRADRPARPGGSRPLPERTAAFAPEPYARAASAMSSRPPYSTQQLESSRTTIQERSASALSHRRAQSNMLVMDAVNSADGRPLVQRPHKRRTTRDTSAASITLNPSSSRPVPPLTYRENGMRWMEKQEARSLREALEDMDLREEVKVHAAAQNEASELVWRHLNEDLPHKYTEPRRNYKMHLEKGAHERSQSQGWYDLPRQLDGTAPSRHPSGSDHSNSNTGGGHTSDDTAPTSTSSSAPRRVIEKSQDERPTIHIEWDSPEKKAYTNLAFQLPAQKSAHRYSSGSRTKTSHGGPFRNPDDKIYDDTEDGKRVASSSSSRASMIPTPLAAKAQNPMSNPHSVSQQNLPSHEVPYRTPERFHRSEIYRNPPSQSRDPSYVRNTLPISSFNKNKEQTYPRNEGKPYTKDGIEIRSDDIRAATSMRMKDRSPRLRSPAVVSDQPGRHIISFDKEWKPKDAGMQDEVGSHNEIRFKPRMPASTASAPVIPTINAPDAPSVSIDRPSKEASVPSISISDAPVPTISLSDERPVSRALPTSWKDCRSTPANRPLPHHSSTTPAPTSTPHWTPTSHRATAQCAACALPISGRIVTAASHRFHPHCFTCHHCAEPLECVAFYPEPDPKRAGRVARIQARLHGDELPDEKSGETAADDGDDSLRFYCHLDYHELFSPRCRSCKTPIESEVVMACGASWHVGHFFCAECGDPFDAKTPFVEKDGYAWCVSCHAGKFSGKCKGCRKPVVERGISALGAEWHEGCFICMVRKQSRIHAFGDYANV